MFSFMILSCWYSTACDVVVEVAARDRGRGQCQEGAIATWDAEPPDTYAD